MSEAILRLPQVKSRVGLSRRWDELPHQQLWIAAQDAMAFGSRARSSEDAVRHVLKAATPKTRPSGSHQIR